MYSRVCFSILYAHGHARRSGRANSVGKHIYRLHIGYASLCRLRSESLQPTLIPQRVGVFRLFNLRPLNAVVFT